MSLHEALKGFHWGQSSFVNFYIHLRMEFLLSGAGLFQHLPASQSHAHTQIHTFYFRPLSLSAGAGLTFRLLPPCWRHTLAHKLWSSLALVYICHLQLRLQQPGAPFFFFFSFDVNDNFDGGISSEAIKAESKLHLRALLAAGATWMCVYGGRRQWACPPGVITD